MSSSANVGGGSDNCIDEDAGASGGGGAVPGIHLLHLAGAPDAFNLSVEIGNKARLQARGCDYFDDAALRWRRDGDTVVLIPPVGESLFEWPTETNFEQVASVSLYQMSDGKIDATFIVGRDVKHETWAVGRVCRKCCNDPQPSWLFSCRGTVDDPLEDREYWNCKASCPSRYAPGE